MKRLLWMNLAFSVMWAIAWISLSYTVGFEAYLFVALAPPVVASAASLCIALILKRLRPKEN